MSEELNRNIVRARESILPLFIPSFLPSLSFLPSVPPSLSIFNLGEKVENFQKKNSIFVSEFMGFLSLKMLI